MDGVRRVLVLNAGSSSLKHSVLDATTGETISRADVPWGDAPAQLAALLEAGIDAVGHRITHGGQRFLSSARIDREVRDELEALVPLDAIHLRRALDAIDAVTRARPSLPQVAAFDTSFHATLPAAAAQYAVPLEWAERYQIRRHGFHGLSVDWATSRVAQVLGRAPRRLVVCHLGSGCSITAVEAGRSVDTTMGYSPLEGLVMATRSGSIDAGAVLHLVAERGLSAREVRATLTERSGWLGVSGISADLQAVMAAADAGHARARLAVDLFTQSLRRSIGAMAGVLGGVDAIVFTGGVGERSARVRRAAATALPGLVLDDAASESDAVISTPGSAISALVVHAREDLVVLRELLAVTHAPPVTHPGTTHSKGASP